MKKICLFLAIALIFPLIFISCDTDNKDGNTSTQEATTASETATETTLGTEQTTASTEATTEASTQPQEPPIEEPTVPKSLKILAIGNSFSTDAMEYLYQIAKSAGVETVVLGNMYIGSCSIDMHLQHAEANDGAYTYYKNTTGTWTSTTKVAFETALKDEDWDVITMQQTSKTCGLSVSYSFLDELVEIVEAQKTNPDAKLLWHMTWAYQQDSTHTAFVNYDKDQMTMYEMTVGTVKSSVMNLDGIDGIIPSATSVQNARTSFVGDRLTRDGYHMDLTLGRYIVGLTYFAAITGMDVSDLTYSPSADVTPAVMAMAKDAVMDSIKTPYAVTPSTHTEGKWYPAGEQAKLPVLPSDCFEADMVLAQSINIDLTKYELLEYGYLENGYYYCTKGNTVTYPGSSVSTYQQNICTDKIYSIEEIPVNSIIICDTGWQFRPELWVSTDQKASSRPTISTAQITLMDASWWGNNRYFAMNISSNPKVNISEFYDAAASHVRIYIPKDVG